MSAYVIGLVSTGAILAAAALVLVVALASGRGSLRTKSRNAETQRALSEIQNQIDAGRSGY